MHFDYVDNNQPGFVFGSSSTGAYARASLTGAIVDLVLMVNDGYSSYQYKGLLEISQDDQHTHTIRWIKKNSKNGQWYTTSSWVKI
jgi:hypothetical protein